MPGRDGTGPERVSSQRKGRFGRCKGANAAINSAHFGTSVYRMRSCGFQYRRSFSVGNISPENQKDLL